MLLTMMATTGRMWGQTREDYSVTYNYSDLGSMLSGNYTDASSYWKVPGTAGNSATIAIPITNQPTSNITITFSIATFGSGDNPSSSNTTITAVGTETGSNWSGSAVSSYPSSSTYVNGVMTITKPANPTTLEGLTITMGVNTGVKIFRLKSITVSYTYGGSPLQPCDLALTNAPIALEFDLYDNNDPQVINYTTSSTGAVTVNASNYVTTEVNANAKTITVTPTAVTPSLQTITVNQAADATYAAGSATFTVSITDSTPFNGVIFNANEDTGTSPIVKDNVSFACDNGVLNNGSEYRLYKNSTTNISTTDGSTITKIEFTGVSGYAASNFTSQNGWSTLGNDGVWEGEAGSVSFVASVAQVRATVIRVSVLQNTNPSITADDVNISCDATNGSITYEINNPVDGGAVTSATITDSDPNGWLTVNGSNPYTSPISLSCEANTSTIAKTATVQLTYTYDAKETVTKDVTVTQAGNPNVALTTIPEIFAAATTTETNVNVTFGNWVVSGVSGSNAYVTDNIGNGFIIYTSDHGFAVNDKLSGTVTGTPLKLYSGSAEFTNLTTSTTGLSVSDDGEITLITNKTIAELGGVNTGAVITLNGLTYDGTNLSDGTNTIKPYNSLYSGMNFTNGKIYNVTGVYVQYGNTKEIAPRSAADIVEVTTPTLTTTNVNITSNATEGAITYTLENPTQDGVLTAEITAGNEGSWLTLGDLGANVPFTCTANTGDERTATVTLTYTYNTNETVTAASVVTQAAYAASVTVDPATVNAPYSGADGTLNVTYNNITDINAEVWFCNAEGTVAASYDWITADINAQNNVEYLVEDNDGDARTAYFKVYALDDQANDVYSNLVTVTQAAYVIDYATIPFSYDGNGNPDPVPTGMTLYSIGNYDNSPKMKFDAAGDYVIIYYHGEANKLSYTVKNNSFSGGQFDVLESANGVDYTTIQSYSGSTMTGTMNESYEINPDSKYIKFIYTTKKSGNIALGAISIKYIPAPTDSWKLNEEPVTSHEVTIGEANTFPTFVTTSDGAKTYTSTDTGVATINETTGEITLMSAGNTTIKCATAETATYLASEKSYTLTVNAGANYTVTYHVNGATSTSEVPAGNLNLTEPQNIPGGYTYVGWTDTEIIGVSSDATYFTSYNVTANVDLYAVFSMERYDKMVSVPTPGTYVIASKIENTYKVFAGQDGNNSYGMAVNVTEITPTNVENYVVTIASTANGYSIKYGNIYLGWTTGNSLDFDTEFTANYNEWTFAMNDGNVDVISKKDNTRKLKWNASSPRFACYTSAQTPVILFKKVLVLCTTVSPAPIPVDGNGEMTGNTTIPSGSAYTITTPVTVPEGITLTVNGTLGNDDPANLVINDGGQVIVNNAGVQATFKKSVSHSPSKDDPAANWYTISSPVNNIAPGSVTNLIQATPENYDLYYYDEATTTWFNHKAAGHAVSNMTNGRGYLYWNAGGEELAFAGELNTGNVNVAVTADGSGDLAGINLIGNPYSHNIYKGDGTAIPNAGASLVTGFYVLSNSDSWVACTDNTTAIKPGQGILVKTTTGGTVQMTNTTSKGTAKAGNDNIRFTVANNQYEDVAYALFKNEIGLDKINHRNAEVPMLYIPQDGINYAIATMSDDVEMFTLSFKTVTTSKYTLSVKLDGRYDYLHIIDCLTGEDVDMLVEGEYSFMGTPKDLVDRFIVKLKYDANINDVNDIFAYQSGSDVIVNGEGELQIFDLMGRKVMTQTVNGVQTVNVPAQGVYIFRLNGKVQKIVVK